jgi:uncharacterized protein (DUF362 family)/Pyruvate/2-oxoacid:ferredoxin oxidoreductase delta subunit
MSKVVITKCDDYNEEALYESVMKVFSELGGIGKFVKEGMTVALKPNLLLPQAPEAAAVTHPLVVAAIGRAVREAGGKPVVVESPGGYYNTQILKILYKACGLAEVCGKYGIDLNYDTSVTSVLFTTDRGKRRIKILKPLMEADLVINISKMKTHGMMIFTGAVKNMFGAVAGVEKAAYHINTIDYDAFANELIDIFLCVSPRLNFMDAVMAMEGKGPSAGTPRKVGLVMGSESGFALDSAAHDIIGIDRTKSFILRNAVKRGLDTAYILEGADLDDIAVKDFDIPYVRKNIRFFERGLLKKLLENSKSYVYVDKEKCTSCGICMNHCPAQVITFRNDVPNIDHDKCIRCFCCHELCPNHAMDIKDSLVIRFLNGKRKK